MTGRALPLLGLFLAFACKPHERKPEASPRKEPAPSAENEGSGAIVDPHDVVTTDLLREHTRALSDDAMQGRGPGTKGGERAVAYIVDAMKSMGLEPAGDEGTYLQGVSMRSVRTAPERTELALVPPRGKLHALDLGEDIVVGSFGQVGTHRIDAPIVFAGYGVTAPEHDWDDYDGLDVKGKIVAVFVGDPPVEDGRFGGDAMTYYGRWTYKFERALEAGALGCLVIHETEPASYGWNVVRNSWSKERFHVVKPGGGLQTALGVQGWISKETAAELAGLGGKTLEQWHREAVQPGFRPLETGARLKGEFVTNERRLSDANVIGKIPGSSRPEEAVFVSAHWDHLGTKTDAAEGEDAIFNGAVDNASGIAGMLSVAAAIQARARAGQPPGRTVIFLATTAEEQGLLGSKYYAANPIVPIEDIVAVVNLDSMNVRGRTRSIQVVGAGQSDLEDILAEVGRAQGRTLVPEERPEAGGFYRSDHFSFAKRGVPAIYFRGSTDMKDGGTSAGEKLAEERARHYHTVEDEYHPGWSFEGAEQDAEAVMDLVIRVADSDARPGWKPKSEFAAIRPDRGP